MSGDPTPARAARASRGETLLTALLVLGVTFALYFPTRTFEFLNYDDDVYVTGNPALQEGFTLENVGRLFRTSRASNWHPLTWLSHMADVRIFGLDPGAHHLVNAGFHALSAALFLLLLVALTGRLLPSLFASLFFSLHPLRAESVAWVSERKDLLACFFFLLTLLAHTARVHALQRGESSALRRRLRSGLVFVALALGLLAKPMLVTAPFVLLLLDVWPLRRRERTARLVAEKLGLFLLVGVSVVLTLRAQRQGGAMDAFLDTGITIRLANAFAALKIYLETTLWPHDLALFYPHPACFPDGLAHPISRAALEGLGLFVLLSLAAWRLARRVPAFALGWLWFLGTLLPVIGIVQVGLQSHADRYTLIPGMGLAIALAFGLPALWKNLPALEKPAAFLAALWLLVLTQASRAQIATWRSSETAMSHALAVTDRNFLAETNLARALEDEGRSEEALEHYLLAARYKPDVPLVHYQLGRAFALRGKLVESTRQYRLAIAGPEPRAGTLPEYQAARASLGINLSKLGEDREAIEVLGAAWNATDAFTLERIAAGQALAWVLATSADAALRDGTRALAVVNELLRRQRTPGLLESLAAARAELGDWDLAVEAEGQALQLIPRNGQPGARARLALYRAHEPYRRSQPKPRDARSD